MIKKLLTLLNAQAEKSNRQLFLKNAFLVLIVLFGFKAQAQVSSYTVSDITGTGAAGTYVSIAGQPGTTNVSSATTWTTFVAKDVLLGFNFNFNGKIYDRCNISSNGFITFGAAPTDANVTPISSTEAYEGAIAVYGQKLFTSGLHILKQTTGAVGNRTFTVQYNVLRSNTSGAQATGAINMQIMLHESHASNITDPGKIELRYLNVTASAAWITPCYGQVGIRGESNADFYNKTHTAGQWPLTNPVFQRGANNAATVITKFNTSIPSNITQSTTLTFSPPACFAPLQIKATPISITQNSASIVWTVPVPAPSGTYHYLVTTSPAPSNINFGSPIASTTPTGTVTGSTISLSSLSAGTTYYIYMRSVCAGNSGWSSAGSFSTLCTSLTIDPPYTINFTGSAGTYPMCTRLENNQPTDASFGYWYTRVASSPDWGFTNEHLRITSKPTSATTGPNASNFFTRGVYLVTTKSYRLSYKYGASAEVSTTSQNLKVAYGTAPVASAMTITLEDHVAFRGGPYTNVENFIPPADGIYYIGFMETTPQNSATTMLDDIVISESTCLMPSGLISGLVTETSATIGWSPPATAPGDGYLYYLSTSATAPVFNTAATGSATGLTANLSGLTPNTTYYFWVRSNCGNGDMSGWSLASGTFTTPVAVTLPPASCTPVSSNSTGWISKFSTTGALANISNTSVYSLPNGYGDYTTQAVTQFQEQTVSFTILTGSSPSGSTFTYAIWVDWNNNGTFETTERVFFTTSYTTNTVGTFTVPASAVVGSLRMRVMADYWSLNPNNPCAYSPSGPRGETEDYRFNVLAKPTPITLSATTATTCSGVQTPAIPAPAITIATGASSYNAFYWTPAPTVSGDHLTGYRFTPAITTTYTLTALNTTTFETTSTKFTVFVNQPPTSITINPVTTTTVCEQGPAVALTASGGIISGVEIFKEDFNGEAPGWLSSNSSTGSFPTAVAWYLQPDGYSPWSTPLHSNDRSQFALTDSDDGGSFTVTRTGLISPEINLTGYTTASLSFWHFYKYYNQNIIPESARVQYSTSTSGPWTDLIVYPGNADIGTYSNFVNAVIDLTPAIPSGVIYLQFYYQAQYDYGWAIDNVLVSGSSSTAISWSPSGAGSGLYTDAAATTVYTGGPAATVYALPSADQTYTASASSGLGCQTATQVSVVVTDFELGTTTPADQNACSGDVPANIVLAGNTASTILRWESSPNATFLPVGSITNIPVTTATLTPAQVRTALGILTTDRYFRPVLAGCVNKAGQVVKVSVPSTTWTGTWSNGAPDATKMAVFAGGSTTIGADLTACTLVIQNGTITVAPDVTLTVANGVRVSGGSLIFSDDASLLQTTSSKINTGNITYRRLSTNMIAYDYTYWSSPVDAQTLFAFSPDTRFDKYYTWNATAYQWQSVAAPASTLMSPGVGYMMRAPDSYGSTLQQFTGNFIGIPNNGDYTVPIVVNGANNFNFIGNPYPSAIDAEKLMQQNPVTLGGGTTFYYWTHNNAIFNQGYNFLDYAMFNYSGGLGVGNPARTGTGNNTAPSKYIAAGQGFMAVGVSTGDVVFNNTMRVGGINNRNFYKTTDTTEIQKNRIWLEFFNADVYKQMLVGYIENATNSFENAYDAEAMEAGNAVNFYSVLGNKFLGIQGRALPFDNNEIVPLGYRTSTAGQFNIRLSAKDGFFNTQQVYLEDKLLNVVHDMNAGDYNFVSAAGTFNDRFVIRYTNEALGLNNSDFNDNSVVVYKDRNGINFKTAGYTMSSIKIYDVNGRELLMRRDINSDAAVISNLNAAQQMLLIKITSTDGVVVNKKIIF